MTITELSCSKKLFTLCVIILLCVTGIFAYFTMSRAEDPLYIVRTAEVTTYWPGASPERVEQLVTDKIEKRIQEISEVDYIESESKTGVSVIRVHILDQYKAMRPIWDELRRKVEDAERDLPLSAQKPIVNDDYGDIYGIVVGIVWDGFEYAEIEDIAEDLRNELLEIHDVAKVALFGVQEQRIFIDYSNDSLRELGLSAENLESILRERNIIQSGGILYGFKEQIAIEPTGNYVDMEDIRQTLIPIPGTDKIITLEDVAEVYRGYLHPPQSLMRSNGKQSIGIAVSLRDHGDILKMGAEVIKTLKRYRQHYPIGIEFEMLAYQPERVVIKIDEFVTNLIQAVLVVCAVMFLFLGLRVGFIVASLIPTVILITFVAMSFIGIGLNQITLASLIIALGMLVDNAIVMSESIMVQMQKEGKSALKAAIQSAKELRLSLLISSLTTCAAFLPFYLAKSGTGEYVGALFLVVTITLLSSWVIALTMIPILCIAFIRGETAATKKLWVKLCQYLLFFSKERHSFYRQALLFLLKKKKKKPKKAEGFIYRYYRRFLLAMLKHRLRVLAVIAIVFVIALIANRWVPKIFYPPSTAPMFTAEIELPVGSSIWRTEATITEIETFIQEKMLQIEGQSGVVSWATFIGNGGPRFRLQHDPEPANSHYAFMLFTVSERKMIDPLVRMLDRYLFENYPDVKPRVRALQEGTPVTNPIEVRLTGKKIDQLYTLEADVKRELGLIAGTKDIDDDWGLKGKKVVVVVDEARAKRAGITNSDIAYSLESAINGVVLTEFREDDDLIPMVLRSLVARDLDLIGTEAFNVFSQTTGRSVPLLQVADIYLTWEPSIIFRRNRLKTITVMSSLQDGYTANQIEKKLIPYLEKKSSEWPIGYRWELGGENEESGKAKRSIFRELPIAVVIILVLLLAQFNSLRKTGLIIITIPLSFIGVVIGLLTTGSYFGIMTILGLISLAGIVINNAVVLIDRIRIEQEEEKRTPQEAILAASVKRFRPILLTTITTATSLIPLWLGGGPLWEPMAITIIFGLLIGTILTLGVVPVLYSSFFQINYNETENDTFSD